MVNLLQETLEFLRINDLAKEDVSWVGWKSNDVTRPIGMWKDFEKLANFEYDNSYGGNEINSALVIVGKDWWLERGEYDGSEWWELKTLPVRPVNGRVLELEDIQYIPDWRK